MQAGHLSQVEVKDLGIKWYVRFASKLLGPERLHRLWLEVLDKLPISLNPPTESRVVTKLGELRSPIGLAAGYDKTGKYARALAKLGFGYVVVGTFTMERRVGHPRPRIAYRPSELAVVNAMGMPNPGIAEVLKTLKRPEPDCKLVISITGNTVEEVVTCYRLVSQYSDGVEVNISSPNFPSNGRLQNEDFVSRLASELRRVKARPTYLKIPPVKNDSDEENVLSLVKRWLDEGFEGITAVNALPTDAPELKIGRGGLSGAPLKEYMLKSVRLLRNELGSDFEINAVGGILTGRDAAEAMRSGATTVQILTALLYRGHGAAVAIAKELLESLSSVKTLAKAVTPDGAIVLRE